MVKTNALLSSFVAVPSRGMRGQITDYVRDLVVTGKLAPDVRLPSAQQLAQRWGVQYRTVHNAFVPLVKECLLIRTPRRGTFVRRKEAKLACIGVYEYEDYSKYREAAFARSVHAALAGQCADTGVRMRLWIDPRPLEESLREPLGELAEACRKGEIQGLICPRAEPAHAAWLARFPVALAIVDTSPLPNAVIFDARQFMELSLHELARAGCRSVGLISIWPHADRTRRLYIDAYERFFDLAGQLKLRIRDDWIHVPRDVNIAAQPKVERYGYEHFKALWESAEHPEGLIVTDDVVAKGVITGLLEAGVHVPADLKLVLHRNREIDLVCPMPAVFLESSAKTMSAALFGQVQKQFNGKACERVLLPFRLVRG